jgi:hypothetical protein
MDISMNGPKIDPPAPLWQRGICAVFAAVGAFPVLLGLFTMLDRREVSIEALILPALGAWGCVVFGHAAVTGRLPRFLREPGQNVGKSSSSSEPTP